MDNIFASSDELVLKCSLKLIQLIPQLQEHVTGHRLRHSMRPQIDRYLIQIFLAARDLFELLYCLPVAEGQAMPLLPGRSHAVRGLRSKYNPTCDFHPWFIEKVTLIHESTIRLMRQLEKLDKLSPRKKIHLPEADHILALAHTLHAKFKSGEVSFQLAEVAAKPERS